MTSLLLKKGSKAFNQPDSHGSPTYIVHNQKSSNWNDKKGIGYQTDISLHDLD